MQRYSPIETKCKREIVLLRSFPCKWGKCTYCDYTLDNNSNSDEIVIQNREILKNVVNKYGVLEILNSGSLFELPLETLNDIKSLVVSKNIKELLAESHWMYRKKLKDMQNFFGIPIRFQFGIETFNNPFRVNVLGKGTGNLDPAHVAKYFDSVHLMVGIKGQTKEMIQQDIQYLLKYFAYGRINIFTPNSTPIKPDVDLINWFKIKYSYLELLDNIEILWNNTDLGVGTL